MHTQMPVICKSAISAEPARSVTRPLTFTDTLRSPLKGSPAVGGPGLRSAFKFSTPRPSCFHQVSIVPQEMVYIVQGVKLGQAPTASPPRSSLYSRVLEGMPSSLGQAPSQGHRQSPALSRGCV